mgnify:CR=1 FL=1
MKNTYEVRYYGSSELLSVDEGLSYRDAISLARTGGGYGLMAESAVVYHAQTGDAVVGYAWSGASSNPTSKWVRILVD